MKWFIISFVIFVIVTILIFVEINYPSFLQKYVYLLSVVITSILLTVIAYLNYNMTQSNIYTKVIIFHKNSDIARQQFPNLVSETGFFLMVIAENSGRGVVNPKHISNNKGNTLYLFNSVREKNPRKDPFGYILEEGERYVDTQMLNKHYLKIFKESSSLYVEDIRRKKYLISKKDLRTGQKYIKNIESGLL